MNIYANLFCHSLQTFRLNDNLYYICRYVIQMIIKFDMIAWISSI